MLNWILAGLAVLFWGFVLFWYTRNDIKNAWRSYRQRWTSDDV